MRAWLTLFGLAACYAPTVRTGAPCTMDSDCPPPQVCRTTTDTCELSQTSDDAPPSDTPPAVDCWDAWLAGTVAFSRPARVPALHIDGTATSNVSITADELAVYITRGPDLLRATRASRDVEFDTPIVVPELQTPQDDSRLSVSEDQLVGVFASTRTGTQGQFDLWHTSRASKSDPFGDITAAPVAAFNNANQQFDPELAPNGLALYWAPSVGGIQAIHRATRASRADVFGAEVVLPIAIPNIIDFFDPSISPDERVLVVGAQGADAADLAYVTFAPDGSIASTTLLTELNTTMYEGDPEVTADGCTIYFASNRDGLTDIYSATVVR